jgi:hypothetical protein
MLPGLAPRLRYRIPEFSAPHSWIMDSDSMIARTSTLVNHICSPSALQS